MLLKLDNKEKDLIVQAIEDSTTNTCMSSDLQKKYDSLLKKVKKSMQKIKPKSAKNRGLSFQKKVAGLIGSLIGIEASQDDDSDIKSRLSGQNGTDIILTGKAKELFKFSVECKDCNSISLPQWISQAKSNETEDRPWLLFIHSQLLDDKDVVVMKLESFEKLFKGEK